MRVISTASLIFFGFALSQPAAIDAHTVHDSTLHHRYPARVIAEQAAARSGYHRIVGAQPWHLLFAHYMRQIHSERAVLAAVLIGIKRYRLYEENEECIIETCLGERKICASRKDGWNYKTQRTNRKLVDTMENELVQIGNRLRESERTADFLWLLWPTSQKQVNFANPLRRVFNQSDKDYAAMRWQQYQDIILPFRPIGITGTLGYFMQRVRPEMLRLYHDKPRLVTGLLSGMRGVYETDDSFDQDSCTRHSELFDTLVKAAEYLNARSYISDWIKPASARQGW